MVCNTHLYELGQTIMTIENLTFSYNSKEILNHINLDIKAGVLCGLLGPNGSGKTTLFKCCLNFYKPISGVIKLNGQPLNTFTVKHLAKHVAYVPQNTQPVFPFLVREMVQMGRTPHRTYMPVLSKNDHMAVDHALERMGLTDLAKESFNDLSGGQRQLVLVARALAQEAFLMFLDEPTSSLDFNNQLLVWQAIRNLANEGMGIVICCHDPNHILWFCDEVAVLKNGSILKHGSIKDVMTQKLLESLYERHIYITTVNEHTFIHPN